MVTSLQAVRTLSSEYILKALKETDQQSQSQGGGTRNALLQRYGIDTSSSTSNAQSTLTALLNTLSAQTKTLTTTDEAAETAVSTDIQTASFMTGLKQKLEDMAGLAATSKQATSMLAALEAGTLTVTDPAKGITIKAWDVDSAAEKETTSKTGDTGETTGWSQFLKSHLTRGDSGAYAKTADGSYIDASTGDSAYFGTIGSGYVYLSWPQAKTDA
ncbi:hypothetical protein ADU59_24100 [Pararhizobium polonicum]|uniref:Uncharacterized protein n=1 Tax=Pararhizobium polonicum TaxID=1612624 RepID=A0A1C7NUY5_9HYPH|nr:hypothetical protein [Pararhizobium polonicum]OBZ92821.1 hypothetical protein ADU59_24100 [Pararhizobium polonicum]